MSWIICFFRGRHLYTDPIKNEWDERWCDTCGKKLTPNQ